MRRGVWTALLAVTIASIAFTQARGQSLEVIEFDDHPANPVGTPGVFLEPDFYAERGVRFSLGGTVLEYDEGFTSSGSNGLEMCYAAEFCSTPFQIGFDSPQQSVMISVGYSGGLDESVPVRMVAYDSNGVPLDVDEILIGPGSPVPIAQQLSVGPTDPRLAEEQGSDGLISAVEIGWLDDTRAMNSLAIDDLVYEPFVPFVEFETDPTELIFSSSPSFGEVLVTNIGNVAAVFDVAIAGDAEAIRLDETRCREELTPGDSCTIGVGFDPAEEGEYTAAIVLISPQLEQNHEVPIAGSLAPVVGPPPTTDSTGTTGATGDDAADTSEPSAADDATADDSSDTDESAVTDEAAGNDSGIGEQGPDLAVPLTWLVAIGGAALLFKVRPRRSRGQQARNAPRASATVRVSPNPGATAVTMRDRQPVTGIRVLSDRGSTTLIEEDQR